MGSILDTATPVENYVESVNMVVYGDSGSGKTYFAGSGREKGKNDLLIAIDHGTISAAQAGSRVNTIKVSDYRTFEQVIQAVIDEPDRFDWVIVDSATKLQDLIWKFVIEQGVKKKPERNPHEKQLQEYGEVQSRFLDVVNRLSDCSANIIWTAQSQFVTNEEGEEIRIPDIHGKGGMVAMSFAQAADVVAYISKKKTKSGKIVRYWLFDSSEEILAKSRFNFLSKPKINFTLEQLTELLEKESVTNGTQD